MIFKTNKHSVLYNNLLTLSRNIFFYKNIGLSDTFETRIFLMFLHFSILMNISKNKGKKFDQKSYDYFFHNIEYNLRELGFGDVTVNKKMKELNKVLYDILLKFNRSNENNKLKINKDLIIKYFSVFNDKKESYFAKFEDYFISFYDFCFELSLENMIEDVYKFKY